MDAIDRVVEQWAREKPDLDTEPMAIMGRLMRIANTWNLGSPSYIRSTT